MKKHDLNQVAELVAWLGARDAAVAMDISRARIYQLMEKHKKRLADNEAAKANPIFGFPHHVRRAIRKNYGDISADRLLEIMRTTNLLIVPHFGPKILAYLEEWAKSQQSENV